MNNVPIPKHILSFGAELEKLKINKIDLNFLHEKLVYRNINNEDRIFTDNLNSIKLTEAASGIQSVIPILLPLLSQNILSYHRSFVIEEPELNLFPIAQYELIKLIESQRIDPTWEDDGAIHTYTTHSPYILSTFNNMLYAYKTKKFLFNKYDNREKSRKIINEIIPTQLDPNTFTAYQIKNGTAESVYNHRIGLINDNYIDQASDKMSEDFEALMELMK